MTTEASRTPSRNSRGHSSSGRDESRAVRRYLKALSIHGPDREAGDSESMAQRIEEIDSHLATAEPAIKIALIQERMDLYSRLKAATDTVALRDLEREFVAAAGAYSARKGITYAAWREVGVEARVLERAGIAPTAGVE